MTLAKGNHVVKLDSEGKPLMGENAGEVYVEYEIEELTPGFNHVRYLGAQQGGNRAIVSAPLGEVGNVEHPGEDASYVVALLRKVR